MLHQGRGRDPSNRYVYYIFMPGKGMHCNSFQRISINGVAMPDLMQLSIPRFCDDIAEGASAWLNSVKDSPLFKTNYESFMRLRPEGIPGYVSGVFIS